MIRSYYLSQYVVFQVKIYVEMLDNLRDNVFKSIVNMFATTRL